MRINKFLLWFLIVLVSGLICSPVQAGSYKYITLTDGSVIRGKVLSMINGRYTIMTQHLGKIQLDDTKIASINAQKTSVQAVPRQTTRTPQAYQKSNTASPQKAQMKDQVQALQGQILSDPKMMNDIGGLLNNPKLMSIISDQRVMDDLMSYDPARIEANPNIQKLMRDPEMQKLMKQIQQQMGMPSH